MCCCDTLPVVVCYAKWGARATAADALGRYGAQVVVRKKGGVGFCVSKKKL